MERCSFVLALLGCLAGCASGPAASPTPAASPRAAVQTDTVHDSEPPAPQPAPPPPVEQPSPEPVDVSQLPPGPVGCDTCGPAPGYPSQVCPDGVHQGGRGPCVKLEDGRCGWLHLVCEASSSSHRCAPDECGAAPTPLRWRCPDEVHHGEFACVRSEDGRCGWTERACLGPHAVPPPPPQPAPPPPPARGPCDPLPSRRELATWDVQSICQPGGGPVQPERRVVLELNDGTFIIEDARGCFRARYRQCNSK
jgi:hypothetical protein